ncbi:MAG: AarF/UbiB family protein [Flavobacterium sp.]
MRSDEFFQAILFVGQVLWILASEGIAYVMNRDYEQMIDRVTVRLAAINMLYVKVFQAIALNQHLIDDRINRRLLRFTDQAPWTYDEIRHTTLVRVMVDHNIGFEPGYETPINAGMISLVFKGYKRDHPDQKVILKLKRYNIEQVLDRAIRNLLFVIDWIPLMNRYQIAEVVRKNVDLIRRQTNFLEEVDHMERIRENCKHLKYVVIPKANRAVTEAYPNVILMDYVDGIKIGQISPEDYEPFAKAVIKFGLVTSLVHGVTHGDLHGGNILFIKDANDRKTPHKIGIIDFGIIYEVQSNYKSMMFDVFTHLLDVSPRESAEKILSSGILDPPDILRQIPRADYVAIVDFTEAIIADTIASAQGANQLQIYRFLHHLKNYLSKESLRDVGIRPSDDFVKSQLVLAMAHGVTLTLCKDNFIGLMDTVLNELFHTQMLLK